MLPALMALLQGENPDQVVWTADLSYWMEGQRRAGKADPAWDSEAGYLEFHRRLGVRNDGLPIDFTQYIRN